MDGNRRRRRRRRNLRLSKILTFSCLKSGFKDSHSQIGLPGFSREVFIDDRQNPNSDDSWQQHRYCSNYVSSTKYHILTFLPKSLFEQFRRVANFYFLTAACLSFTNLSPFEPLSVVSPLVFVIGATMLKEAIEDGRRYQMDKEVNNREIKIHIGSGVFRETKWRKLKVGDVVKVGKDCYFPADLLLLSSSYDDGVCYVETMNLDGETNLKLKLAVEPTSTHFQEDSDFRSMPSMTVRCEDPNANLYTFVGNLEYETTLHALSPQQLLLRDSKLRNTEFVYGAVIFTGRETKVMENQVEMPSKRSKIEKKMDKIIALLLSTLVFISVFGSIFFGIYTGRDVDDDGKSKRWYLQPEDTTVYFDPERPAVAALLHFVSALVLYGYFIPISLYVTIEIVKILQSIFINRDMEMYDEVSDKPAHARTSNLNEELGQVDTVLSDKTGTLTSNSMEFIKCSIAGISYGNGITEVERSLMAKKDPDFVDTAPISTAVKGFNFIDDRITGGNWMNQQDSDAIQMFFRVLATCHTAIPNLDKSTGEVTYEAESPDEAAFVIAGRELGFQFYKRSQTTISLLELDPTNPRTKVELTYDLLNVLEFSSSRKRMSVIVRDPAGKLMVMSKGADSVMLELLSPDNGSELERRTRKDVDRYAEDGLRTLVLAYRELSEKEYMDFDKIFRESKTSIGSDREEKIENAARLIENDLTLLGATAVEDRLQMGVPQCIDSLSRAGIKIWVLTGDKMETAINIGFACSLLRQEMKQIKITPIDSGKDRDSLQKSIKNQINNGLDDIHQSNPVEVWALIIDGTSLDFVLQNRETKDSFYKLAACCASVICCRSSPIQKALVTRFVKLQNQKTTLAIGDGANDVGMLKEADIGVGISGFEGMQAVMASDVAIAQFRFLERLLLVHGHWCYRRISSMVCYFFYKNITFGFTLFFFEAFASFSGIAAYNDWFLSLYNVFFTSLPVIALGVFDQDVSAAHCIKFPILYKQGIRNSLFRWIRILGWMINGILNAVVIFFLCTNSLINTNAFRRTGEPPDMQIVGVTMYTCVVWVVNVQMVLFVKYFTVIHHVSIWGGILLWYIFLLIYGAIPPRISETGFMVFVETCASSPYYWMTTLCVVTATLIPYLTYSVVQTSFFPMCHEKILFMQRFIGDTRNMEVEPTHTHVGCTARLEAKLGKIRHRVHHALQTPSS